MGSYLDKPITTKETHETEANGLKFGVSAMQGWRVSMEDAHTIIGDMAELADLEEHSFIAVYDGHGGQFSAEYCGRNMVEFLKKSEAFAEYRRSKDIQYLEVAITDAFLALDEALKQEDEFTVKQDTSGCTAICAIITPSHIIVGNAGDSRGVLYTSDAVVPMSRDHKPYLDDERKRIEDAGGTVTMQRVDGDLALSRSIGDFHHKDPSLPPKLQKVTAEPEVVIQPRGPNVEVLILACDGVWDVFDNEGVGDVIRCLLEEGEESVGLIAEELLDQCLLKYSKDNISAVLVTFPAAGERHYHKGGDGVMGRRRRRQEQSPNGKGGVAIKENGPLPGAT